MTDVKGKYNDGNRKRGCLRREAVSFCAVFGGTGSDGITPQGAFPLREALP